MERAKGILYAALSSSTFGLAPLFTLLLLAEGYSPFEALSYRWGVAALFTGALAVFRDGVSGWDAANWSPSSC